MRNTGRWLGLPCEGHTWLQRCWFDWNLPEGMQTSHSCINWSWNTIWEGACTKPRCRYGELYVLKLHILCNCSLSRIGCLLLSSRSGLILGCTVDCELTPDLNISQYNKTGFLLNHFSHLPSPSLTLMPKMVLVWALVPHVMIAWKPTCYCLNWLSLL